ncbi:MAG TPA: transglutaminase domain-containing protein [Myxococcota bacterium]|nr:transglutaminase domain-containing protein [Myxococcota bacterium]
MSPSIHAFMHDRKERQEALAYYAMPGPFTDLAAHRSHVRDLPEDLAALCRIVQGLIIHPFHTKLYGLEPQSLCQDDVQIRSSSEMLDRVLALDARPLSEERRPDRRFVGNCRHFTVLLCALLRARGAPARARCGFGAYFNPASFEDHWVCEVWDETRGAWRLVDAQIDEVQRGKFGISFDPLDVPRAQFLVAGDAWQRCRSETADPLRFGIMNLRGLWFVRGNVVRDLASFAKRELLPWDGWGFAADEDRQSTPGELALLDRVAALTQADDSLHEELLKVYGSEPGVRVPRVITSFRWDGKTTIDLGPGVAD